MANQNVRRHRADVHYAIEQMLAGAPGRPRADLAAKARLGSSREDVVAMRRADCSFRPRCWPLDPVDVAQPANYSPSKRHRRRRQPDPEFELSSPTLTGGAWPGGRWLQRHLEARLGPVFAPPVETRETKNKSITGRHANWPALDLNPAGRPFEHRNRIGPQEGSNVVASRCRRRRRRRNFRPSRPRKTAIDHCATGGRSGRPEPSRGLISIQIVSLGRRQASSSATRVPLASSPPANDMLAAKD